MRTSKPKISTEILLLFEEQSHGIFLFSLIFFMFPSFEYKKLKICEQTFLLLKVQICRFTKQKRSNIDTNWFRISNYNIIFWSAGIPKFYISYLHNLKKK
eukprot:552897_1